MKRITDPTFRYTPAVSTDIRRTFDRIRKQQAQAAKREQEQKVIKLKART